MTDPIADMITRIRNAFRANHKIVQIPASNIKKNVAHLLYEEGYIKGYKYTPDNKQGLIEVHLKYTNDGESVIKGLRRFSKPGLRQYAASDAMPRVQSGLGIAVISTNRGIMTDRKARKENVGGEILFYVW